jgi:hypothetical protein
VNETQARTIREAHDGYVKSIYRKTARELSFMYRLALADRGREILLGGPSSKDELISALVELRYPLASMNESVHVLYHRDGITNDACEQCATKPPARPPLARWHLDGPDADPAEDRDETGRQERQEMADDYKLASEADYEPVTYDA